jgi:hypothetical protein
MPFQNRTFMKPIFEISLLLKIFLIHLFFPFITKTRRLFLSLLSQIPSVFKKKHPYSDERVGACSLKLTCVNLITLCTQYTVSYETALHSYVGRGPHPAAAVANWKALRLAGRWFQFAAGDNPQSASLTAPFERSTLAKFLDSTGGW